MAKPVVVRGVEMSRAEAAKLLGITTAAISQRVKEGRPVDAPKGERLCKSCGNSQHIAKTCGRPPEEPKSPGLPKPAKEKPPKPHVQPPTVTIGGISLSYPEAAAELGIPEATLRSRIRKGTPIEPAFPGALENMLRLCRKCKQRGHFTWKCQVVLHVARTCNDPT